MLVIDNSYSVGIANTARHTYMWTAVNGANSKCCWSVHNVTAVNSTAGVNKTIPVCSLEHNNCRQFVFQTLTFGFKSKGDIEIIGSSSTCNANTSSSTALSQLASYFSTVNSFPTSSFIIPTLCPSQIIVSTTGSSEISISSSPQTIISSILSPALTSSPIPTNINLMCTGNDIWPDTLVGHNATGTCYKETVNGTLPLIYITFSTIY